MPAQRGWLFQSDDYANERSNFNSSLMAQRKTSWEGVYDVHTNAMVYPRITQPSHVRWELVSDEQTSENALTNGHTDEAEASVFKKVPTVVARNFMVTDTVFEAPEMRGVGTPGIDDAPVDVGTNGLPPVTPELLELLPAECREALLQEKEKEREWKTRWTSEAQDGMRGKLRVAFLGWPQ
jgi:chromatin structure-remodeling complex protein RSC7